MLILDFLRTWSPVIEVSTLVLLAVYVIDTARIRRASVRQADAVYQPCLVLAVQPRPPADQVADGVEGTAAASRVHPSVAIQNIGTGPAVQIQWRFIDLKPALSFSIPYILAGEAYRAPLGRQTVMQGRLVFEATYSSVAGVRFRTRQPIDDGQCGTVEITHARDA